MIDTPEVRFTITDLKQYIYCPRILYYHTCLPDIRPVTYKMKAGIDAHEVEQKRAARRTMHMYGLPTGERTFDVPVVSEQWSLSGIVDEVVTTSDEMIPVDYKSSRREGYHFQIQLTAYALLLEETHLMQIKRGFLYLIPARKTVEIQFSTKLRRAVERALTHMHEIANQEVMPEATEWRQRCADCEFRRFCNDV